jgi:hypothetical protein
VEKVCAIMFLLLDWLFFYVWFFVLSLAFPDRCLRPLLACLGATAISLRGSARFRGERGGTCGAFVPAAVQRARARELRFSVATRAQEKAMGSVFCQRRASTRISGDWSCSFLSFIAGFGRLLIFRRDAWS